MTNSLLINDDPIKYCVTTWGAVLKVNSVKNTLVDISDPDAVDAGMYISDREVERFWFGWRPKDKSPEPNQRIEVLAKSGYLNTDYFIDGDFQYNRRTDNVHDKVILWREIELPY